MAIHFFLNFDVFKWLYLAYYWVCLHQTCGFCKTWSALYDYVVLCGSILLQDVTENDSVTPWRRKAMPSEILENISPYCVISLANFRLLFNLSLIRSSTTRGSGTPVLSLWSLQKLLRLKFQVVSVSAFIFLTIRVNASLTTVNVNGCLQVLGLYKPEPLMG